MDDIEGRDGRRAVALTGAGLEREIDRLDGEAAPTSVSILGEQCATLDPKALPLKRIVSVIGDSTVDLRPFAGSEGLVLLKYVNFLGDARIIIPAGTAIDSRIKMLGGEMRRRRLVSGGPGARLGTRLGRLFAGKGKDYLDDLEGAPGSGLVVVLSGLSVLGDILIEVDES